MASWLRGHRTRTFSLFTLSISAAALLFAACSSGDAAGETPPPDNPSQNSPRIVQERRSDVGSENYQIVDLTNPAERGQTAEVTGKVPGGTTCTLRIRTAIGTALNTEGVGEATADDDGQIRWEYEVGERTIAGTATAYMECPGQTVSRTFRIS